MVQIGFQLTKTSFVAGICIGNKKTPNQALLFYKGSGAWIRTKDLRVMSPLPKPLTFNLRVCENSQILLTGSPNNTCKFPNLCNKKCYKKSHEQWNYCRYDCPFLASGFAIDRVNIRDAMIVNKAEQHDIDSRQDSPSTRR